MSNTFIVHVDYPMLAKNSVDSLEAKDASSSSDLLPLEEELKLRRARDDWKDLSVCVNQSLY